MINKRLRLVIILLVAFLFYGCPPGTARHHILVISSTPDFEPIFHGFKTQMEQLGFREGVHVTYQLKYIDPASMDSLWGTDDTIGQTDFDLVFAFPTEAALAAMLAARQIPGIPLVFAYAGIEGSSLVASVREPGGHVTGVRYPGPEQIGKRLEMLCAIAPHVKRVWIGYKKDYPNNEPALAVLRPLARSLGIDLVEAPVNSIEELAADLDRRDRSADPGVDAMILMPDTYNHSPQGWQLINGFASRHHLPIGGSFLYTVEQGAVFGNANDLAEIGKLAAPIAAKIFGGIPAGTIPVVTPEQDLYINYRRARELGLRLPEGLLRQAKVILR